MAQVSKYLISKEVYDRIFDLFLKAFTGLGKKSDVAAFFEGFLTPTEKIMLAKRFAISLMLAKDYQYRDIAKVLRVSSGTIGAVSINYKTQTGYQSIVKKIIADEKIEDFWLGVAEIISSVGYLGTKGSGSWRYLKGELKKKRLNEAPLAYASGIFSFASSEQNPPKRKKTSHSSSSLRTRFSAKADKPF